MAKIIDYPRASLRAALQLAEAVDGFGGSCTAELAAEQLGKKISGAFNAQIGAAAKYGLVESKGGRLTVCPLYRNYKLSYTPEEEAKHLRQALLAPPLFGSIYDRFKGQRLPVTHFEKMLIREFQVPADMASRVAGYFLDGAKQAGLLGGDNTLSADPEAVEQDSEDVEEKAPAVLALPAPPHHEPNPHTTTLEQKGGAVNPVVADDYWLTIRGPGMNFSIEIKDSDDLDIVQVMLRKIERALKSVESPASGQD